MPEPTLMELSSGGGCGCKASPEALQQLLAASDPPVKPTGRQLLVGNSSADDCAAWLLNDEQVLVSTTDFFMPVVNDAFDFGRIAATNAISDVYAMGAQPILALALVGMPLKQLGSATVGKIMQGGQAICSAAGIPIAGGHTIETSEPIYGLAVSGLCHPTALARNDTAQDGNALLLGKPLGIGILSAALRKSNLTEDSYAELLATTTQLNLVGPKLAEAGLISAMTDVTGFGILGHALEICRGAGLRANMNFASLPVLATARQFAQAGVATGASKRNWDSYGAEIDLVDIAPWQQDLLTDPQTSGGLLVACPPANSTAVLDIFHEAGFAHACQIGELHKDARHGITVTP